MNELDRYVELLLETMVKHRTREEISPRGARWSCACGERGSMSPFAVTTKQHQAQAVLDALIAAGWRAPVTIDGEAIEVDQQATERAQISAHAADCALNTSHHLTCTCGVWARR